MNNFFRATIFLLSFIIVSPTHGQIESVGFGDVSSLRNDAFKSSEKALLLKYSNIEGSPYQDIEFVKSDIYFTSGSIKRDVRVRLNLYEKNVEFLQDYELFILININHVKKIVFPDKEIAFLNREGHLKGFYEINISGNNMLVSSLRVEFKEAVTASNSYNEDTKPSFQREKEKRYILMESGELIGFKNKKEFYIQFANNESLLSYVKQEKLNPQKFDSLVKIVNFMNREI